MTSKWGERVHRRRQRPRSGAGGRVLGRRRVHAPVPAGAGGTHALHGARTRPPPLLPDARQCSQAGWLEMRARKEELRAQRAWCAPRRARGARWRGGGTEVCIGALTATERQAAPRTPLHTVHVPLHSLAWARGAADAAIARCCVTCHLLVLPSRPRWPRRAAAATSSSCMPPRRARHRLVVHAVPPSSAARGGDACAPRHLAESRSSPRRHTRAGCRRDAGPRRRQAPV